MLPKISATRATPRPVGSATNSVVSWVIANTNTKSKNSSILETRTSELGSRTTRRWSVSSRRSDFPATSAGPGFRTAAEDPLGRRRSDAGVGSGREWAETYPLPHLGTSQRGDGLRRLPTSGDARQQPLRDLRHLERGLVQEL